MAKDRSQEYATIDDCEVKAKTLRAVLVEKDEQEIWVPLSLSYGDPAVGDNVVNIASWFAKKAGLI
ncbi:MAG: hypothetical protein U1E51_16225 [Candidatus Binatia bacterium]|nr:hypothetical protein [Candidatus Binatia bacterium]